MKLKPADYKSDQEPRWCPGCEDYAILKAMQMAFAELGLPRHKIAIVSGIGCSSRLPYYMSTYGFHGIHGRPIAIATGVKLANPSLSVWVITGDGDGLSIGGNHLLHVMRRNVDLNIILFDNRIYGLTKGQYSPTSPRGMKNKTAPFGVVENPLDPVMVALSAGATFVARVPAGYLKQLVRILIEAYNHKGTSFIHVYQNCYVFNDGAFDEFTDKEVRDDRNLWLEHGKPMIFGKNRNKGIRRRPDGKFEVVEFDPSSPPDDLVVHDETDINLAFQIGLMHLPEFPVPLGVIRRVRMQTWEEGMWEQVENAKKMFSPSLEKLFFSGDVWEVKADGKAGEGQETKH